MSTPAEEASLHTSSYRSSASESSWWKLMFYPHPNVTNYLLEGGDVVPRVWWRIINALEEDRSLGDEQRLVSLEFFCLRRELEKLEHLGRQKISKSSHVSQSVTRTSSRCHSAGRGRVMKHSFSSYLRPDGGVNEDSKIEASVTEYLLDTRGLW